MNVYRAKRRLTLNAENAQTPEEALAHVLNDAYEVLGKSILLVCEIKRDDYGTGTYQIEATFEEGASRADH